MSFAEQCYPRAAPVEWAMPMPETPEELIKRQRLNRKILMYFAGSAGLVLSLVAIACAVWFTAFALAMWSALAIGLPLLLIGLMAWRSDPDRLPD
jgi:hypothetical protein